MSLDADLIVDRRRMRRKLTFWRVVAIVLIVLAIGVVAAVLGNRSGLVSGPYIARVTVSRVDPRRRGTGAPARPARPLL